MGFHETPRCEFEITIKVRWFLNSEEVAELFRAMACSRTSFDGATAMMLVDWINREKHHDPAQPRTFQLIDSATTRRFAEALLPSGALENEPTRKKLRDMFAAVVGDLDKYGAE